MNRFTVTILPPPKPEPIYTVTFTASLEGLRRIRDALGVSPAGPDSGKHELYTTIKHYLENKAVKEIE